MNQEKNQVEQQFCSTTSSLKRKSKNITSYVLLKYSLSESLVTRSFVSYKVVVRYEIECKYLIDSTSQTKCKIKQIDVNNPKSYLEREQPTKSIKTSTVKKSKSNQKSEVKTNTDSRKKVLTNTSKMINQDLVIAPDAKNSESGRGTEFQTDIESDGEAIPVKEMYIEGIFWRPTLSMQKPKVRKKQGLEIKDKKLAVPNVTNLNDRAISNQANKAVSPKPPNQKSRSG